jgi:chromosome segregation ATPase
MENNYDYKDKSIHSLKDPDLLSSNRPYSPIDHNMDYLDGQGLSPGSHKTNKSRVEHDPYLFDNIYLPNSPSYPQTGQLGGAVSQNVYDYLISFKEKYNLLQLKLNDLNRFKIEIELRNKKIGELENLNHQLKEDSKRANRRNDEYTKLNTNWEHQLREIKNKLLKIEEEKQMYKEENDNWKCKYEEMEFKLKVYLDKEKIHEENLSSLKKIQREYEISSDEMRNEYREKEDGLRRKFDNMNENIINKMKEQEREYVQVITEHNNIIKSLEKELDRLVDENNNYANRLHGMNLAIKDKDNEYLEIIKDKDNQMRELELNLKNLTNEANNHVYKLNNSINDITQRVAEFKEKEDFYKKELSDLETQLSDSVGKMREYEQMIHQLKHENKHLVKSHNENSFIISEKEDTKVKESNEKNVAIKKMENEILVTDYFNL